MIVAQHPNTTDILFTLFLFIVSASFPRLCRICFAFSVAFFFILSSTHSIYFVISHNLSRWLHLWLAFSHCQSLLQLVKRAKNHYLHNACGMWLSTKWNKRMTCQIVFPRIFMYSVCFFMCPSYTLNLYEAPTIE